MNEYLKPEVEFIDFASEDITIIGGNGGSESNTFTEDEDYNM